MDEPDAREVAFATAARFRRWQSRNISQPHAARYSQSADDAASLEQLLAYAVDPALCDEHDNTLLHASAASGALRTAKLVAAYAVFRHRPARRAFLDARNCAGASALDLARAAGASHVVSWLLALGAADSAAPRGASPPSRVASPQASSTRRLRSAATPARPRAEEALEALHLLAGVLAAAGVRSPETSCAVARVAAALRDRDAADSALRDAESHLKITRAATVRASAAARGAAMSEASPVIAAARADAAAAAARERATAARSARLLDGARAAAESAAARAAAESARGVAELRAARAAGTSLQQELARVRAQLAAVRREGAEASARAALAEAQLAAASRRSELTVDAASSTPQWRKTPPVQTPEVSNGPARPVELCVVEEPKYEEKEDSADAARAPQTPPRAPRESSGSEAAACTALLHELMDEMDVSEAW